MIRFASSSPVARVEIIHPVPDLSGAVQAGLAMSLCRLCTTSYPGLHDERCPRFTREGAGMPVISPPFTPRVSEDCEVCRNEAGYFTGKRGMSRTVGEPCPRCGNDKPMGTFPYTGPPVIWEIANEKEPPPRGWSRCG